VPGQMFIRHSVDLLGDISDVAQLASTGERVAAAMPAEVEVRP
jgi:hypothetical protein